MHKCFKWLIDYANSTKTEEEEFYEYVEGISHLEAIEVDELEEIKITKNAKKFLFESEQDDMSYNQDEFYQLERAYYEPSYEFNENKLKNDRKDKNQINFWMNALDCAVTKKIRPGYLPRLRNSEQLTLPNSKTHDRHDNSHNDVEIMFLMAPSNEKIKIWNSMMKSPYTQSKYWKLMLYSFYEAGEEEEEEKEEVKSPIKPLNNLERISTVQPFIRSKRKALQKYHDDHSFNLQPSLIKDDSFFKSSESLMDYGDNMGEQSFVHEHNQALLMKSARHRFREQDSESDLSEYHIGSNQEELNEQFPQTVKVSPFQVDLWIRTFKEDSIAAFKLWFNHFDTFEKVSLWNHLKLPDSYYNDLDEGYSKYERWIIIAQNMILGPQRSLKRLSKVSKQTSRTNKFEYLYSYCCQIDDYKTPLWLPLDFEEKLLMFLVEKDQNEAMLMSALIICECLYTSIIAKTSGTKYTPKMKQLELGVLENSIKQLESKLNFTLDNILYDKYLVIAEIRSIQATIATIESITSRKNEPEKTEDYNLLEFIKFLSAKNRRIAYQHQRSIANIEFKLNQIVS